ncbi:MAG: HAMP domain-containing sensor histidine kinase, partial [Candidatus Uhrbacteria bacterium]
VSLVSHQLKTPLSIFKLYLEELISQRLGKINKDQKDYLEEMQHNNENLIWLVGDLLDISRMESGKIQFQLEPTCLDHLIKQVVDELHSVAVTGGCKLFFINHLIKDCPFVYIDPNKVEQAVVNLISNAIKYSSTEKKKGQVVVEIWKMNEKQTKRLRPKTAEISCRKIIDMVRKAYSKPLFHIQDHQSVKKKQDYLLVKITDNGIGIPEDDQKNIFSKFYRGANVSVHNTEGTGLGLFITKVIIESCKGEIWFESKEGKGTTVYFTIPIEKNKVQKDKKYE